MAEVRAKKALGQHFLTDLNIARKIAYSLEGGTAENPDKVLEVGCGMGVLTQFMLQREDVVTYGAEIDSESVEYLHNHYPEFAPRLTEGDFLPYDSRYIKTRTINYANLPLNPDSKHEIRWSVVAGLCGAVLSMIVIFVHSLFDVTIYDKKKLEDSFSIPVLGVIPRFISEEGKE